MLNVPVPARARFSLAIALILTVVLPGLPPEAQEKGKKKGDAAVPVSVAKVERRDVPHRISSIGTVQSLHTVVIRPQVTGILTEVLFKEGELVNEGALLARIDDRAIRASLAQAEAEKASKAAQLKVA